MPDFGGHHESCIKQLEFVPSGWITLEQNRLRGTGAGVAGGGGGGMEGEKGERDIN